MPEPADFHLIDFCARLDEADLPPRLRDRVRRWLPDLATNPHRGAFPEPGRTLPESDDRGDRWIVAVPHAYTDGLTVVCSFALDDVARVLHCNWFALRDDPPQAGH